MEFLVEHLDASMVRLFKHTYFQCPTCDGRMQRITYITQSWIITAILECAEDKEEPL